MKIQFTKNEKYMNKTNNENVSLIKKGGNIVIISSNVSECICTVDGKASKIRNGNNSPIKHQIFDAYSQYAKQNGETYWADLFMNASKGVFSNRMYKFNDGISLTAKIGNIIHKCDVIPPTNEKFHEYYLKCKEFITNTSGAAIIADDVFITLPQSKVEFEPWSGSIQPNRQIAMINIFCDEAAKSYSLSEEIKNELKENLISKIFSGELNDQIVKEGHTIKHINGLFFQNGQFFIQTQPPKLQNKIIKKSPSTTSNCEENKEKFIFKCSNRISTSIKNRATSLGI